jgi:hypothetical protein
MESSACARARAHRIIGPFVLTWTDNVSPPTMTTCQRPSKRSAPALHAPCMAIGIAVAGLLWNGFSPVNAGVVKTL